MQKDTGIERSQSSQQERGPALLDLLVGVQYKLLPQLPNILCEETKQQKLPFFFLINRSR